MNEEQLQALNTRADAAALATAEADSADTIAYKAHLADLLAKMRAAANQQVANAGNAPAHEKED